MKCKYCGEEEGTEKIANPNLDMGDDIDWFSKESWWMVCKDCKEVIKSQQQLSFGAFIKNMKSENAKDKEFNEKHGQRLINKANKELDKIAKRTKKPILNACIFKKKDGNYDTASITFTGE